MFLILVKRRKIMIPCHWRYPPGNSTGASWHGWGLIDLVSILVLFSSIRLITPGIF